jgi:hypothetical protein
MLDMYPVNDKKTALAYDHFPTTMQAVIWRNWDMVPVKRISRALRTDERQILELAEQMGLPVPPEVNPLWLSRGYITIIRANWHLLPYEQLLELLGWSESQLAFTLKEDDFLWIKLGGFKPATETVHYRPLTNEEIERTNELRQRIAGQFSAMATENDNLTSREEKPFSFLTHFRQAVSAVPPIFATPEADVIVVNESWTIVSYDATRESVTRRATTTTIQSRICKRRY